MMMMMMMIQDRLQRELDAVVPLSSGRLPDLSDEPNLPFTEAFTLEVMRYKTLVPLLQHATLRDTEVDSASFQRIRCYLCASHMLAKRVSFSAVSVSLRVYVCLPVCMSAQNRKTTHQK